MPPCKPNIQTPKTAEEEYNYQIKGMIHQVLIWAGPKTTEIGRKSFIAILENDIEQ